MTRRLICLKDYAKAMNKKLYFPIVLSFFLLLFSVGTFNYSDKLASAATVSRGEAVFEVETGRMLYVSNADIPLPPASTTKTLTAIIIIEDCDLDEVIKVTAESCGIEGSSIYLVPGEKISVRDLLYGLMLRSGNDCAETLALHHSGSIGAFVQVMNERAKFIGAVDSCFKNPHGLPCEGHLTTAHDLGLIAAYALRNTQFSEIVQTSSHVVPDGGCGYARVLQNKNKMLSQYEGADGVKTGYTKEAGRCLVASATRNNMRLVTAVLNSPQMYERCGELLDNCFVKYSMQKIFDAELYQPTLDTEVRWKKCKAGCKGDVWYPLADDEIEEISVEENLPTRLSLPIKKGDVVGEVNIYLQKQLIFSQKIVSIMDVNRSFADIIREIAEKNQTRGNGCALTSILPRVGSVADEPVIS